jgi:hypothetical protein
MGTLTSHLVIRDPDLTSHLVTRDPDQATD